MTAESRVRASAFRRAQVSKPSISGIITSSRIRSGTTRCAMEMRVLAAPGGEQAVAVAVERLIEDLEVRGVVVHQQNLWSVGFSGVTVADLFLDLAAAPRG